MSSKLSRLIALFGESRRRKGVRNNRTTSDDTSSIKVGAIWYIHSVGLNCDVKT